MLDYLESPAGAAMLGRVLIITAIVGILWWISARKDAKKQARMAEHHNDDQQEAEMARAKSEAVKRISEAFDKQGRKEPLK